MGRAAAGRGRGSSTGSVGAPGAPSKGARAPSGVQAAWLARGLDQAGGKLPLFDADGRRVAEKTIRACIAAGWAEPWFSNPIKPDWLVCRLTEAGRAAALASAQG
ncbi:hypothetical protein SAMN05421512_101117 [Stappia indica]|uniref:Uncharacterized protein n=2 Tax=Stappia indica TaxID=538381 RepID=A0A285R650_9HYPH|nr:hypothetical protein SAMN05421512_101117 [Stappia indica]